VSELIARERRNNTMNTNNPTLGVEGGLNRFKVTFWKTRKPSMNLRENRIRRRKGVRANAEIVHMKKKKKKKKTHT